MSDVDDTPPEDDGEPRSDREDTPSEEEIPDLAHSLLHARVARDDLPGRRWAYPFWGMVLASGFIVFHAANLLVHNLPSKGLSKGIHTWFNKQVDMNRYLRATGSTQSWAKICGEAKRDSTYRPPDWGCFSM